MPVKHESYTLIAYSRARGREVSRRIIMLHPKGEYLVSTNGLFSFNRSDLSPTRKMWNWNYSYKIEKIIP